MLNKAEAIDKIIPQTFLEDFTKTRTKTIPNIAKTKLATEEENFKYCQVSLEGSTYQPSTDQKKAAVFINGRFYILSWMH